MVKNEIPRYSNQEEVYVKAGSLPDVQRRDDRIYDPDTHHFFHIKSLTLSVEGSKYTISSDEPSKFTLKCIDQYPQDVLVEVQSLLFQIMDARRARGITSQVFHVLKPNESMTFEIGVTDHKNITLENFNNVSLTNVAGYMTITQIQSFKTDDSDESWGIKDNKKLARLCRTTAYGPARDPYQTAKWAHWKEKLFVEKETEEVRKAKILLEEALLDKRQKQHLEAQLIQKKDKKMYKSPEEVEKEQKALLEERKKILKAEQEKRDQEEKKKKCVIS